MYWNETVSEESSWIKRLIETWDVLKSYKHIVNSSRITWLIETWDVLKWGCAGRKLLNRKRLIETWDVLKLITNFFDSFVYFD